MKKEKNFREEIKDASPVRVDAEEMKTAENVSAKKNTADANENTGKAPVKTTFFKDKTQEVADGNGGTVRIKRAVSLESLICIGVIVVLFALLASKMGFNNLLNRPCRRVRNVSRCCSLYRNAVFFIVNGRYENSFGCVKFNVSLRLIIIRNKLIGFG